MDSRKNIAENYFTQGYNCAQSVVLTFADLVNIYQNDLLALSSSFGGGMGRLREVCGAVSGMFIICGLLYGYESPEATDAKAELYARIQNLGHTFEDSKGTIICRELLGLDTKNDSPTPEKRTAEYYQNRPCKNLVGTAAEILEKYISENPPARK